MKKLLIPILLLLTTILYSQHTTLYFCEVESYDYQVVRVANSNPAPCTIHDQSTTPTTVAYGIRVAYHRWLPTAMPEVHAIPFIENGQQVYYYYVNAFWSSKKAAKKALAKFQYDGYFCDGWVREYPIKGAIYFTK